MYPEIIEQLIDYLKRLPGIGNKGAERMIFTILSLEKEIVDNMADTLKQVMIDVKRCKTCGHITINEFCDICLDDNRDKTIICVVEQPKDVIAMEKTHEYNGLYHVLNGYISIIDGVGEEDINFQSLIDRIDDDKIIKEIIIATNPTREGETTSLFIQKKLKDKEIEVSRIANGLPMGGSIDYADELTLIKSLQGRKKV